MKYFVAIDGREVAVEVDGDRVRVDGRELRAHLTVVPGTPIRHLLAGVDSLALVVEPRERGEWRLSVEGTSYLAEVVDERTRHIRSLTGEAGKSAGSAHLRAPMPGLVVRVLAREGDQVVTGQALVVLEAMKMENELRSVAAGVVGAIRVVPGQAVEKGQVLLDFSQGAVGSPPLT
ncbi:MAG: biotin/lipoyl-containing protein [Gemmatimonadota bacterium]